MILGMKRLNGGIINLVVFARHTYPRFGQNRVLCESLISRSAVRPLSCDPFSPQLVYMLSMGCGCLAFARGLVLD